MTSSLQKLSPFVKCQQNLSGVSIHLGYLIRQFFDTVVFFLFFFFFFFTLNGYLNSVTSGILDKTLHSAIKGYHFSALKK